MDVDGDGDLDLALLTLQGLRLFENTSSPRAFARIRLRASRGPWHALGAQVRVEAGGVARWDFVKHADGFATQVPLDVHVGLGDATRIDRLTVTWPDGTSQSHEGLPVGRMLHVTQGGPVLDSAIPSWLESTRPIDPPSFDGTPTGRPVVRVVGADTIVYDGEGRPRRLFRRPVTAEEIRRVVEAIGSGTFHADYASLSTHHLARKDFGAAMAALRRAIEQAPDFAMAHYFLGLAYGLQGRHADAAAAFARTTELDADFAMAHLNRGVALQKLGRLDEAEAALREALRVEPDSPKALQFLGQVLARQGRFGEAIDALERSLARHPDPAAVRADLEKVRLAMRQ